MSEKRIFSIPSGAPFLTTLASALVEGELFDDIGLGGDPFLLADTTIYLPTRRAARSMRDAILAATSGNAALLPDIRTLGDEQTDEVWEPPLGDGLPEAINESERQLYLAGLVLKFAHSFSEAAGPHFDADEFQMPATASEAARLAGDLAGLLDQLATEEVSWSGLQRFAEKESRDAPWAEWWMLSLRFLAIIGEYWPAHLAEIGRLDPAQHRRLLLDARCREYLSKKASGPVIAAGSTGSIPATARLLSTIAGMESGAVVLPGLDTGLAPEIFGLLSNADELGHTPALSAHPQAGLAQLLAAFNVKPSEVREIGKRSETITGRLSLIHRSQLPAAWTGAWRRNAGSELMKSLEGISLVEAANENEEALALAIAMREAVETPGKTAALVTPDRNLARRVVAELHRFGIEIEDSGGIPLTSTASFDFARLWIDLAFRASGPAEYAALVKHELLAGDMAGIPSGAGRLFELAVLREGLMPPLPGEFAAAVAAARHRLDEARHIISQLRNLSEPEWQAVTTLAERIDRAIAPLADLPRNGQEIAASHLAERLIESLSLIAGQQDGELFGGMPGERALTELIGQIAQTPASALSLPREAFGDLLRSLAGNITVRGRRESHPRLAILGPLEARLQQIDLVLLGGLNEGVWPSAGRNDPFLNRPMKAGLGLTMPERRIGQGAHDFQQLSGAREVIYSRSLRADNAPTIASRWLQRLVASMGPEASEILRTGGRKYLHWARAMDMSRERTRRVERPCPRPDPALRPKSLSVTEIELLIRDPYAVFARHVLGLAPLPPLIREADPMLKGSIYHAVLDRFVREDAARRPSADLFFRIAAEIFDEFELPADIRAAWWPRFEAIGASFLEWEAQRRPEIGESLTEVRGEAPIGDHGFRLRGRADRIDVMRDGSLAIFDYKTGSMPTLKQARTLSPQLALEAGMAMTGAFDLPAGKAISDLAYVRLRPGDDFTLDRPCAANNAPSPQALGEAAWEQLHEMVTAFSRPEQGYVSRRAPLRESELSGDYDHLARVREWMVGEAGGDDEG